MFAIFILSFKCNYLVLFIGLLKLNNEIKLIKIIKLDHYGDVRQYTEYTAVHVQSSPS